MFKSKKLIWQIFPSFLIITLVSLTIATWYSSFFFKTFLIENIEKDLTIRLKLAENQLSKLPFAPVNEKQIKNLNKILTKLSSDADIRLTIILASGRVIADSNVDITELENHRTRPEIKLALKGEKGVSIRYSSTLSQNMMYIASPFYKENKIIAVIRASLSIATIDNKIKSIQNDIFLALAMTILVAAVASLYLSRRITRPLEEMKTGAKNFAGGNLKKRLAIPDSEELGELALTMNNMAANLNNKIEAVKNRKNELETIYSSMEEGVIALDNNEKIITLNKAGAEIFDFPISMLEQNNIYEVSRDLALQDFFKKALSTHGPCEKILTFTKTREYTLNIHSKAMYNSNNKRMGTLIIFHDITKIKLLENMHKNFAANVSHELKTPLTAIKGFVETLQNMEFGQDFEKTEEFLHIIDKNVVRMTAIINDLLSLAKLERMANNNIVFESHDIIQIIDKAIKECKNNSSIKQITIQKSCPDTLMVPVDPVLIEQTIINLIDNAIQYSNNNTKVLISTATRDNCLVIKVKDSGIGIPKKHFSKIFNRFYRIDKARSRNTGGTGLGLAIVKHIAVYHNGKASVISSNENGSTFEISLPLHNKKY